MQTITLRKVGGSIMAAIPPPFLELLDLGAGSRVGVSVDEGRLVIEPRRRPKYTLDELLAQCDPNAPISEAAQEWLDAPLVGREEF